MRLLVISVLLITGCSWFQKKCPDPNPTKMIKVEKSCILNKLYLPGVKRHAGPPCPPDWSCYDLENSAKLAERLSKMKEWISGVRIRCGESRKPKKVDNSKK